MFTCRACFRRTLGTLYEHAFPSKVYRPLWRPRVAIVEPRRERKYATTAIGEKTTGEDGDNRPRRSASESAEWAARKQLQFMEDPFHIAQHVTNVLEKDHFEEAALITRKASKDKKVTVSWNRLIDYQLRQGRIHAGIKLYNEMKKRAQLPNAQTYTIIFRSCADSTHSKLAVSEAIRLYNQMLNRERLNPNTIHMNAVVKVCAKAGDIESMFAILDTANDGLRAPNNMTYTTILNALRAQVDKPQHGDKSEAEIKADVKKTIDRAKAIWQEVISRWRAGQVIIDEELVCAMGRILLLGKYPDVDSIRGLIEQTMQIAKDPEPPATDKETSTTKDASAPPAAREEVTSKGAALAIQPKTTKAPGAPSRAYARPGKNSLSLILDALEKTGKTTQAIRYWGIFTRNYMVMPDAENWHRLLQAFRRGKSSARMAAYLPNMPRAMATPKHYRAAMRTCLRDRLNPGAFEHATAVLEHMAASLHLPDAHVMRVYLRVAYACKRSFEQQSQEPGQFETARRAYARQLETALGRLAAPYRAVARHVQADKVVQGREDAEAWARLSLPRAELVALARKMIAMYDRLVQEDLVAPATAKEMKASRNAMNRLVVAYFDRRVQLEPNFNADRSEIDRKDSRENRDDEWDDREEDASEFFIDRRGGQRGGSFKTTTTTTTTNRRFTAGDESWDRRERRAVA